jgi:putative ABC transport system permease protein
MKEQPRDIRPPQWPLKLLRFFLKKEYVEEIEGDMEEIFYDHAATSNATRAKRMYAWEVVRLLRPALIRHLSLISPFHHPAMFRNYFKTSVRNLSRNPLTSFINVFGLSVAIGICLVVYAFMEYDYSIDQFHKKKKEIYLATFFSSREGVNQQYGLTPRPLGEVLRQDFPQIRKVTRVEDRSVVLKQGDQVFHERIRYVDPAFLEMFTFPLKWGAAKTLSDLNSMVLSEDMSRKYFGEENPVGREILMILEDGTKKLFTVSGVAAGFPKAHDIDFHFLVNFQKNLPAADPSYDLSDWSQFVNATFVEIENPSTLHTLRSGLEKYRHRQNEAQPDWAISSFAFEPLATLHSKSAEIRDGITSDNNVEGRIGMPIIAIFMIALACFNYINIAIVSAAKRLKEIGVRKVIGANRLRVAAQFLTENVVTTFFALAVGVALSFFVFVPWFVQFSGWPLELNIVNQNLWLFLLLLLLFTGIASGIYPAFYISRFDAVKIFKGSLQFGKRNPLTKIFLGVQLVLACITITAGVVFTQNNRFQNNRSWGYNHTQTLFAHVHDSTAFYRLRDGMLQTPDVTSVSGSADHLGRSFSNAIVHTTTDTQYKAQQFSIDAHYFETLGLVLVVGRTFTADA